MGRLHVPNQSEFPYHVSARCINKEWFSNDLDEIWRVFQDQLYFISMAFNVKIHAFLLMNNHFHLLISTPNANLPESMHWLMKETSREINRISQRENQVWGGRYYRTIIESPHYYLHAYKYLYINPLRAGICSDVLDYPFHTIQSLLGNRYCTIPVFDNTLFYMGVESCIRWLNTMPEEKRMLEVQRALKKRKFKLSKDRSSGKPSYLEKSPL